MTKDKSTRNIVVENNEQTNSNKNESQNSFKLPSLEQFMDIVRDEKQTVTAVASGYNVYNKYNKTS
jgi:hypothetical protein